MGRQEPWTRRSAVIALAASVGVHLALLAVVLATFDRRGADRDSPPILVQLSAPRARPTRLSPPRVKAIPTYRPLTPASRGPAAPRDQAPGAPVDNPAVAPDKVLDVALGDVLRASVRCAHADQFALDPAERAQCQRTARARAGGAPAYAAVPSNPAAATALDHERRISEAWRNYHNSYRLDDHPGLASMFGGGDPCPPGPVCWHPIGKMRAPEPAPPAN